MPGFQISDPLKTYSSSRQLCPAKPSAYIAKFNALKEKKERKKEEKKKKKKQTHSFLSFWISTTKLPLTI